MIATLLATVLAAGACAPIERAAPDPELAAAYGQVASEEEDSGAVEAAVIAWRAAAAVDVAGGVADLALARLCAVAAARADFEAGLKRFEAGDCRGALPLLSRARAAPEGSSAALLEGVCAYELGEDDHASEALGVAGADPALTTTAQLYLGLLALRRGNAPEASERLHVAASAQDLGLQGIAGPLLKLAEQRERLVIEGSLEGGYDSNATLTAFPTVLPGGADDGLGTATLSLSLRPLRANGPFLSLAGGYRKYARTPAFDLGLAGGSLGWALASERLWGSLDGGADFVSLGMAPWLVRGRGTSRLAVALGRFVLSAEYALRYDALLAVDAEGYSGLRHVARLSAAARLGAHTLELSGGLIRSEAKQSERASIDSGGELRWLVRPAASTELSIAAGARWRGFDALDPDLGVVRQELQLDGQARIDVELSDTVALFALVEARRIFGNVAALSYTRLGASAGLRLWLGLW